MSWKVACVDDQRQAVGMGRGTLYRGAVLRGSDGFGATWGGFVGKVEGDCCKSHCAFGGWVLVFGEEKDSRPVL
jgi:hypothetical protein